jgi:hypothetical protein
MAAQPSPAQNSRRTDLLCGLLLVLLPLVFFWPAASRQGAFFVGDIFRLYYPQRAVLAAALRAGRLPLWSPDVLAGYPLFAEGEMGALYPPNLLLYRFLPIDLALNYSVILQFALAVIVVHPFGIPHQVMQAKRLAHDAGAVVIEDAALVCTAMSADS